jgi:hypothetical protein
VFLEISFQRRVFGGIGSDRSRGGRGDPGSILRGRDGTESQQDHRAEEKKCAELLDSIATA